MSLTNDESRKLLKELILDEFTDLIGDPEALPVLDDMATALSSAITRWIAVSGRSSVINTNQNIQGIPIPPIGGGPVILPQGSVIADIV